MTYFIVISQQTFNENERLFICVFIFASLLTILIAFKKVTEKRLKIVETKNTEQENKNQLKKISHEIGWFEFRNDLNISIFYEDAGDWNKYTKIFLFKDNKIYYTVLTERFRLNYPTFTQNNAVKKLLKNLTVI
ncbi:hypothetical protein [Chryseobacterium sp. Leaf394]|uniref:hypothetical protein n=1 Tax=Chryseobacterium sp. Leaf394 TaxID=1736361 RepID=UPI0006F4F9D0|nr:hypothetical protein [Chryseobacterium sp. Leaf394]KQS93632.1 hypothetical protein ASG21_01265 [Chryseobacterium sp. Leaf394]